jgi:integration host factor subunit beta
VDEGGSTEVGHRLAIKKNSPSADFLARYAAYRPVTAEGDVWAVHHHYGACPGVLRVIGGKMLRSDLVRRILAQNPHLYLQDVEKIVDTLIDEITAALTRGKRIELRGFGTFSIKVHEARTGRNPRTGLMVLVPRKAHPHFKTGTAMKDRLNRGEQ